MTEQRARELLKPCPFCGGEARCVPTRNYREARTIFCARCGANIGGRYTGEDEAIAAWNTRTTPFAESAKSPSDSVREALRCAIRDLSATYEAAKSGKPIEISIGQFGRLNAMIAALQSSEADNG